MCVGSVTQSCLTLCSPMDYSLPGSSVHGISQVIILEWVSISFSRGSFWLRDWTHISCIGRWVLYHWATREAPITEGESELSHVRLFVTPWTVAYQAPPSMGFSRQEYWSGLPFPSPGDLPEPGIEPRSPAFQAEALTSEPSQKVVFLKKRCLRNTSSFV